MYQILRKYKDSNHPDYNKVIRSDLTLEEAQEHCNDPDTREPGVWFDSYTEEDEGYPKSFRSVHDIPVSMVCNLFQTHGDIIHRLRIYG